MGTGRPRRESAPYDAKAYEKGDPHDSKHTLPLGKKVLAKVYDQLKPRLLSDDLWARGVWAGLLMAWNLCARSTDVWEGKLTLRAVTWHAASDETGPAGLQVRMLDCKTSEGVRDERVDSAWITRRGDLLNGRVG